MRGFFTRLGNTIQYFMQGRYGIDELGTFLLIVGFGLWFVSLITSVAVIGIISSVFIVWAYIRCFSKNFEKRRRERAAYFRLRGKVTDRITLIKRIMRERKTHKHFKCRGCKTRLRVPRGKGKIEITCPKCKVKIIKKT